MAKVFWGVLFALLAFSAITFGLFVLGVLSLGAAANQAVQESAKQMQAQQEAFARSQRDARVRQYQQQARAREADLRRRRLSDDERCIAGTVVQISGSSYTQLAGVGGHPVACAGRYRLQ